VSKITVTNAKEMNMIITTNLPCFETTFKTMVTSLALEELGEDGVNELFFVGDAK
jgi:hypothetical protein